MSTININSTYSISGEVLQEICDAVKQVTGQSSIAVTSLADTIKTMNKTPIITMSPASSVTIQPFKLYDFGTLSMSMTIALGTDGVLDNYCTEYAFRFTAGANASISLPNTVKFSNGEQPTLQIGRTYEYNIVDNMCAIGEFY